MDLQVERMKEEQGCSIDRQANRMTLCLSVRAPHHNWIQIALLCFAKE
jgi:hypothetical protein